MASFPVFSFRRHEPLLVRPSETTPHEFKQLSDIDDQQGLRCHTRILFFYGHNPSMMGRDPAKMIKEALAKALVFYYPLAGKLREVHGGNKLIVECTGEGALFVEADADFRLEQFREELKPPFPSVEELLYDVEGSSGIVNCPLLLIQVTRLRCGGFVFGLRINHTLADAPGVFQFIKTLVELARGDHTPSIPPVWSRELLTSRNPPRITHLHPEYEQDTIISSNLPHTDLVQHSFFFGAKEISTLKKHLPQHMQVTSKFMVTMACVWRCWSIALFTDPNEESRVEFVINARGRNNPTIPKGYYGNALAFAVAKSTIAKLKSNHLGFVVELIRKAKDHVATEGYMQSVSDLMAMKGRPHFIVNRTYMVSDVTNAKLDELDFGWGRPLYGRSTNGGVGFAHVFASFYSRFRNKDGVEGIFVPLCLPREDMERFVVELESMIKVPTMEKINNDNSAQRSSL